MEGEIFNHMKFNELILSLGKIHSELRDHSIRSINTSLTLHNWLFGFYIVEFEQYGMDKAGYGKGLLASLADAMQSQGMPNTDERELRWYRQFYLTYPVVNPPFIGDAFRGLLTPELNLRLEQKRKGIRGTTTPELQLPQVSYHRIVLCAA